MHVSSIKRDLLKHFSLSGKRKGLFETDIIILKLKSTYTIYVTDSQNCHQTITGCSIFENDNLWTLSKIYLGYIYTWIRKIKPTVKKLCINSFPHKMKLNLSFRNVKFTFITFEILLHYNAWRAALTSIRSMFISVYINLLSVWIDADYIEMHISNFLNTRNDIHYRCKKAIVIVWIII